MFVIASLTNFPAFIVVFFTALCLYFSRNFFFWKNRGFPYVKHPLPFVGNFKDVALMRTSLCCYFSDLYFENKDKPYVGMIAISSPKLLVRDLDLIKRILVTDAHLFPNRNLNIDEELDPLSGKSILALRGQRWKLMRSTLAPSFSTNNVKKMFYLINNCCKKLIQQLDKDTAEGKLVMLKKTVSRFAIATIFSCSCGVEIDSFKSKDIGENLIECIRFSYKKLAALVLMGTSRPLQKLLRVRFIDTDMADWSRNIIWEIVQNREQHGVTRNDFLDSLMKLRKKNISKVEADTDSIAEIKGHEIKLGGDDFISQVMTIWIAGFETSSSTLTFALYELALHPDIQHRLRMEITQVLTEHNQEVTYDAIKEMKYLDMVVSETLRKYPIVFITDREGTMDYELPDPSGKGTLTLPAGTGIGVPVLAIHMDPEYYPDPENFDPERFTEEGKLSRPTASYLPFGLGPRMCIGMNFALMEIKSALAHILSRYQVAPCKETPLRIDFDPLSVVLSPAHKIPVIFSEIMASPINKAVT